MSKFKDLCQLYNQSHKEMSDYLDSCIHFMQVLIQGMEAYLGIPEKRIQYRNRQNEEKPLPEAMYLEDGQWCIDTTITMCPESAYRLRMVTFSRCYYPRQTILLPLVMKPMTSEVFVMGIADAPNQFTINVNDKSSFYSFYEFLFEIMQAYYKHIFQLIIEQGESPLKVGKISST